MKKLLLSLFGLLTLGLVNFSSAGSFTYTGTITRSIYSSSETSDGFFNYNLPVPVSGVSKGGSFNFICDFSNFNLGNIVFTSVQGSYSYSQGNNIASNKFCSTVPFSTSNNNFNCGTLSSNVFLVYSTIRFYYSRPNSDTNISFDFSCTFTGTNIINQSDIGSCGNNGSSSCESDLITCQNDLSTATGSLATCQNNLSIVNGNLLTCQNDLSTATGNLLTCQSNLSGYDNTLNNCSINLNSCNSSLNSCLQANCPSSNTGNIQRSSLYINDIQHLGAGIIDITIPDGIGWDYLNQNDVFSLYVSGYNLDTEYIDGIIRTQNYKPTSKDFTELVSILAPYSKILIFCLFMFIIWAWIKKPFKSKKI